MHRRRHAARRLPRRDWGRRFELDDVKENDQYRFVSERADNATKKYGVKSVSLLAIRC
jgi:hypothetical protein